MNLHHRNRYNIHQALQFDNYYLPSCMSIFRAFSPHFCKNIWDRSGIFICLWKNTEPTWLNNTVVSQYCLRILPHFPGLVNLFLVNIPILCPLKTPENLWNCVVSRGFKMGTLLRNGLTWSYQHYLFLYRHLLKKIKHEYFYFSYVFISRFNEIREINT